MAEAKIFLAEDDPLMRRMYGRAFKAAGYALQEAADGEAAITMLEGMDPMPDVILLDIMMPKKSGFDVLRAVKEHKKLKKVPVILLSNLSGADDAKKGIELGAELFMVKSEYSPKQVIEAMEKVMKK